ncbi:hypothetical protein HYX00_04980 [Candidatus Woesearchaeota archaeon]|nr:hypothetical protein [Candidatus Woesearchaeota archaeon]
MKETEKSVKFNSLVTIDNQPRSNIPVQTITLKNDFFIPKRFDLPKMIACLNDKESVKRRENLNVRYSEGRYSSGSDIPLFSDLYYDSYSYSAQNVEIPANGKKQVKILLEPKYVYNYNNQNQNLFDSYKDFDEVLLIQSKNKGRYSYTYCDTLDDAELEDATHIAITDKPTSSKSGFEQLFEQSRCAFQSGLACLDFKVTPTYIKVVISNALGYNISDISITADGCGGTKSLGALEAGSQNTYTVTCFSPLVGEKYSGQLSIGYTNPITVIKHINIGQLTAKIENI